jgi:anti-sigma regulatory factor (Ser/Thr protein kinase)
MIFAVNDSSHIGDIRRTLADRVRSMGFDDEAVGRVSIIVTEAATNLVKHATGGSIIFRPLEFNGQKGAEILAIDKGPGRSNIEHCLQDGYSTAGTPGNGLGAIRRLSNVFDIYSQFGKGTIVLSHVWPKSYEVKVPEVVVVGAISEPYPGEQVCGDQWSIHANQDRAVVTLADGLGHGAVAYLAASEAIRVTSGVHNKTGEQIVEAIHAGLRHTRGSAVSVAELEWSNNKCDFTGVGNVSGMIICHNHPKKNLVTMNGTAGHVARKIKAFSYPLPDGSTVLMHSDGIDTRWDIAASPGLERQHPSVIAAAIFRDHRRDKDDATIVVVRRAKARQR